MYNFSSSQIIPLRPSVAITVCLSPWFETDVLTSGLALIRENLISHFFFHRNVAGALFQKVYPLTIIYEKSTRIGQGFTIKTQHCSLCNPSKSTRNNKRCEHIAALCLLSITDNPDKPPFPMPLHFRDSRWGILAGVLHDWLGQEQGHLERTYDKEKICFKRTASEGGLEAHLASSISDDWELFTGEPTFPAISKLYETAQEITRSENERQLNAMGSRSRIQARDLSFWSRLCALFSGFGAERQISLTYNKEHGMFLLFFRNTENSGSLKIFLPRHRTMAIIKKLDFQESALAILQPARQGSSVKMNEKGQVVVDPLLWRNEHQAVLLSEISDMKFGNNYFFPGEGFLPLREHDPKGEIFRTRKNQSANPLLDSLKESSAFIVTDNELQRFLADNKLALTHPDNLVDQQIFELRTLSVPDSLIIHDYIEDQDWHYISCDYGVGNNSISLEELIVARAENNTHWVGTASLQLDNTVLSWFHDLALKREWTDRNGRRGVRLLSGELIALFSIIEDVQCKLHGNSFQNRLQTLLDSGSWSDPEKINSPAYLRNYQKNGLAWLYTLYELGFGGLLADDMGLGKTHQGLALLEAVRKRKKDAIMLVICPASVLSHWHDKLDRFYPELGVYLYYGPNRDLSMAIQSGLILTTYGTARSDREQLGEITFEIILLDEMQNLKNQKTFIHHTVSSFQSRVKIGLSGTPIENSLSDLYALFSICLPGIFGTPSQFKQTFVTPITEHHDKERKNRLSRLIQPFILRRSRAQVLTELPELIEDNRLCELSDDQIALYRQAIDDQRGFLENLENGDSHIDYMNILALITRLKQICNHPSLVEKIIDPNKYKSGKWDLFIELLDESLASGLKVVVFSQYTGMLDIIEYYLKNAGIGFAGLRGSMNVSKREIMIRKFTLEKDCMVFSSSLLAGGTGIDLLAGRVVIHYDRWWNPAKEEQATARVHRMGQKGVVQLFRLITTGTLEDKIHHIIIKKQKLASSVINEDEGGVIKQLGHRQLVELFR